MATIRRISSGQLRPEEIGAIRELLWAAFADEDGGFDELDWEHALGGVHVLLESDDGILSHAAVVERTLEIDGQPLRTGYVEAVATRVGQHGRGHGSAVMREVNDRRRGGQMDDRIHPVEGPADSVEVRDVGDVAREAGRLTGDGHDVMAVGELRTQDRADGPSCTGDQDALPFGHRGRLARPESSTRTRPG